MEEDRGVYRRADAVHSELEVGTRDLPLEPLVLFCEDALLNVGVVHGVPHVFGWCLLYSSRI